MPEDPNVQGEAVFAGWGSINQDTNEYKPDKLQKIVVKIVENETFKKIFGVDLLKFEIDVVAIGDNQDLCMVRFTISFYK